MIGVCVNDIIQLLPDHVANQIAAGEVVQRPASVVKELMENAIDAKATTIQLIIKEAGRELIQVVDNGLGMSVTDSRMAFERHATSKIKQTEDIFKILTKGFRGEALASIAAVAQVIMKSKRAVDEIGVEINIEGNEVKTQKPVNSQDGTTIIVKNLFYNVPARRNFLKSNIIEFKHIIDEFQRVALAHNDIDFQLYHQGEEVFKYTKGSLLQRVLQVFGKKNQPFLVPVSEQTELVKLTGYIGKPEMAKKTRGEQFFFVNNRYIKSPYLNKAVQDAFENLLPSKYQPAYFLFLEINPERIDINIHPTKTEIKFDDERTIYSVLRSAVKHALGQYSVMPSLDFDQNPEWAFIDSKPRKTLNAPNIKVDTDFNPFTNTTYISSKPSVAQKLNLETLYATNQTNQQNILFDTKNSLESFKPFQWQKKYLIANYNDALMVMDQHRVHQKILYELFKKQSKGNALSQQLLFPIELSFLKHEIIQIQHIEKELLILGFDLNFTDEFVLVNALPSSIKAENMFEIFNNFLTELHYSETLDITDDLCKLLAKGSAIKKGESLNNEEVEHLVTQLFLMDDITHTPFGKKIFTTITLNDIDTRLN